MIPGPASGANMKTLRRKEIEYRHTQFGKLNFTTLYEKNVLLIKIDKEIILDHNESLDQIKIIPNILPIGLKDLQRNNISIQLDERVFEIPLIWKKAELSLPGCRIRWIFKKDRFQLTCQAKKSVSLLKMGNDVVEFKGSQKVKYYYPVKISDNNSVLKLYDISGRSFILNHKITNKEVQLVGWIQDRNGLLAEYFNILNNSHQILCRNKDSGIVNVSFKITPTREKIEIILKKMHMEVPVRRITNRTSVRLLTYLPQQDRGFLVTIIDDETDIESGKIQHSFLEYLGFIPLVLNKSEMKKRLKMTHIIFISAKKTMYEFQEKNNFSKSSILSVRYPDGIINLFKILSGQL
jgi:hypothetical protein